MSIYNYRDADFQILYWITPIRKPSAHNSLTNVTLLLVIAIETQRSTAISFISHSRSRSKD
jgi:hypothetical protein